MTHTESWHVQSVGRGIPQSIFRTQSVYRQGQSVWASAPVPAEPSANPMARFKGLANRGRMAELGAEPSRRFRLEAA